MPKRKEGTEELIQEQTPLSHFPPQVISVGKVTAPNETTLQWILKYNDCLSKGDYDGCRVILEEHPEIASSRISTTQFNTIIDEIKATQILFNEEIEEYIRTYVHIDDSDPYAYDRAFSCKHVTELDTGLQNNIDGLKASIIGQLAIDIKFTDWVYDETIPGYKVTKNFLGITEKTTPIPTLNRSIATSWGEEKKMMKAYGLISYFDTEEGSITFVAKYKNPGATSVDIQIVLKGI